MTTPDPTGDALKAESRKMSPELEAAIERARGYVMTPEEVFEQRVSFVFGMQDGDNPNPRTKDQIRETLIASQGRPPCPKCATHTPTTEAGVSLDEVHEVLLDAEALLCEGIEDSPTVREVLKRVRAILTRIKNV